DGPSAADTLLRIGSDGRFRFDSMAPGVYTVSIDGDWGSVREVVELWSDRELTFHFELRRVNGRVVSAAGEPLAGASLSLRLDEGEGTIPRPGLNRSSDADGRFTFTQVRAGTYRLAASHEGFASALSMVDARDADATDLEIVLGQGEPLIVELRTQTGRIPMGVQAVALDASDRPFAAHFDGLGPGGRLEITSIPPGTWRLYIVADDTVPQLLDVEVPGGPYVAELEPAARVRVTVPALAGSTERDRLIVLDASGTPYLPLQIAGVPDHWPLARGETLLILPIGTWELRAEGLQGTWTGVVTTEPGRPVEVFLE
ncbi:MAG: carboxypeptidase-like regulatory domain-containing protein, partial [Acidobacteriota bacterium]